MSKLRNYRIRKNITLTEFGRLIGRSAAAVSRYENGHRSPDRPTSKRIAEVTEGEVGWDDFPGPPEDEELDSPLAEATAA